MGRLEIVHMECQMEFIVTEIVMIFLPVSEPCELQLVRCHAVSQIDQDKASVCCLFSLYFF